MKKDIIGRTCGKWGGRARDALAQTMIEREISPNVLTVTGVLINAIGGFLLAFGATLEPENINWIHLLAGVVILLANVFDTLDGTVARMSGQVTKFGAFFDSVTDRYSDMMLFSGAITYFALRHDALFVCVSALALLGGVMTSYTRARAESILPGKFDAGYMERPERIVVLAVTALFSRLYVGMTVIAVLANLAAFHRIWDVWQVGHNLEHPDDARQGYGSVNSPALIRGIRQVFFWTYSRQTWQHDALGLFLFLLMILAPLR